MAAWSSATAASSRSRRSPAWAAAPGGNAGGRSWARRASVPPLQLETNDERPFDFGVAGEVYPARFALTGLTRQLASQCILARRKPGQCRLDLFGGSERVQARRARAQLRDRLRAAQEQHGDERGGAAGVEVPAAIEAVLVAFAAAAVHTEDESVGAQAVERFDDLGLAVVGDRIATGLLIARLKERRDGEGILLGSRALLLHQRAENAHLCGVEKAGVGHAILPGESSAPVTR
jgi:hypothetical protein